MTMSILEMKKTLKQLRLSGVLATLRIPLIVDGDSRSSWTVL
jgi:hypothetical protein